MKYKLKWKVVDLLNVHLGKDKIVNPLKYLYDISLSSLRNILFKMSSLVMINVIMEFFLNGAELSLNSVNSANSGKLINHWSMNWDQIKDPVSHMCLAGAVVASWSLTQEVAGSRPFTVMRIIFVSEVAEFSKNI